MEEWVNMTRASRELDVSTTKLSKLAKKGKIKTEKDPRDERLVLVDMTELRVMFPVVRRS